MSATTRPRLRVHCFAISLDGYGAGPNQDLENPLGVGGLALHGWAFATRTFCKMFGREGGTTGIDDDFAGAARLGRPAARRPRRPEARLSLFPTRSDAECHPRGADETAVARRRSPGHGGGSPWRTNGRSPAAPITSARWRGFAPWRSR